MATVDFNVQFAENQYNVQFEESSMELEAQFEPNGGGGGGAVDSVNGQTGAVVLDAGDLGYDDEETYTSGTVGKEISNLKGGLTNIQTGTSTDIGKALSPKTVSSGKVTEWQYVPASGGGSSPSPYTSNPAALGTASPGSSDAYARGDHVHAMPTAANVGAIALPSNPSINDFLVFNGSAWVAQSLSTWQGGSY